VPGTSSFKVAKQGWQRQAEPAELADGVRAGRHACASPCLRVRKYRFSPDFPPVVVQGSILHLNFRKKTLVYSYIRRPAMMTDEGHMGNVGQLWIAKDQSSLGAAVL
jgi:hypothetical protein